MGSENQVIVSFASGNTSLKRGQPAFFLYPDLLLLEAPTSFLNDRYCTTGKRAAQTTWKNVAHALTWWLNWCLGAGVDWQDASRDDLVTFRDCLQSSVSPQTGRAYASGTIANRLQATIDFYDYCGRKGLYEGDIIFEATRETRQSIPVANDRLAHLRKGIRKRKAVSELLPKKNKSRGHIRPFLESELIKLLEVLGPLPSQLKATGAATARNRLMIDWLYTTGLRLSELTGLKAQQILDIKIERCAPLTSQKLEVIGKGSKRRIIAVPSWLIEETHIYIATERATSLGNARSSSYPDALFLSEPHHRSPGRPIGPRQVQALLASACIKAGLTRTESRRSPVSGERIDVVVPSHSAHDLRHTYAVLTFRAESLSGNAEPWKMIQGQLGHAFRTTTVDTYLTYVDVFVSNSFSDIRTLLGLHQHAH